MTKSLETRLKESVSGTPLLSRFPTLTAPFLEQRAKDTAAAALAGPNLCGLARVLTSNAEAARYLSHRPTLLERIARASPLELQTRAGQLEHAAAERPDDLEGFLDWLRLTRRDDTILAACLDFGGSLRFDETAVFLSILAEACTRWALAQAEAKASSEESPVLSLLGMGKIAGRELTYHSDLDLIFLYPDEATEVAQPSRTAQRLINYLTAMTGAGVAYAVDSRLRPSGRQGALVTTYGAFERYQREHAATWEHLALMRARAIAGDTPRAQQVLDHARMAALERHTNPWSAIGEMRARVERKRGRTRSATIALKTGAGGLMDVEFLASGGLLECGMSMAPGELPTIAWMLRATADGPTVDHLLEGYYFLRRVEACNRWIAGRAEESLRLDGESIDVLAELVEPGLTPNALAMRLADVRQAVRSSYDAVLAAGTIHALNDLTSLR